MKFLTLLLFFLGTCSLGFGQVDNHASRLKEKRKLCEQIQARFSGKPESIDSMITVGNEGIKLAKANDYADLFVFHYVVGVGYYYKQDFAQARKNFEVSFEMGTKAKQVEMSLKPLGNLIAIYHYLGLQDKADETAQKLKQIADNTDTLKIKSKSDIYYNLGVYNQQQKFYYSIALEDFLKSVELHKPLLDTTKVIKYKIDYGVKLMMVAEIYLYLKQPKKALQYLEEAKPFLNLSLLGDISIYGKFIRAYALLNDEKRALQYYNILHNIAKQNPSHSSELVSSNVEMANLALRAKNYDRVKYYADKASQQANLDHKDILVSSVNILYGDYYKATRNFSLAGKYYKLAEKSSELYNKEEYVDLLKSLTEIEIQSGNQAEAGTYFKKYTTLSDSLSQRKISLNLAEMEARFQNKYKQEKIGLLNQENEAKNLQLKQERITRFMLIGGAVLLLIALFSIYINYRNKQKVNLLLDQKNKQLDIINTKLNLSNETKTKLFSIISHDLRSPVSQLFTFLKLQQSGHEFETEEAFKKHQQKLIESSTNLLETMEDLLLWSKSQMEHFELEPEVFEIDQLFSTITGLMQGQAYAKHIAIEVNEAGFESIESDYNLLLAILRNLVQNAINNAFEHTSIVLSGGINQTHKKYLSIHNMGPVIPPEKIQELLNTFNTTSKSSGYGLMIVKELAEKLNARIQISSDEDHGTVIQILFQGT